ncbi:MAG: hypothetical protein IJU69_00550 [Bacteroidales bacterium]|nr:hypothetical protein [Bacteroidales bacterium]
MNEDLHIEKAAGLADRQGAENLATDRAREFVAKALDAKKEKASQSRRGLFAGNPVFAWGAGVLALAACIAAAVIIIRPSGSGYGTPGQVFEDQSVHAATETVDSTATRTSDSLAVETIIEQ